MQVLRQLNRLLDRHPEARRRNLAWNTPSIVPVWPQVGPILYSEDANPPCASQPHTTGMELTFCALPRPAAAVQPHDQPLGWATCMLARVDSTADAPAYIRWYPSMIASFGFNSVQDLAWIYRAVSAVVHHMMITSLQLSYSPCIHSPSHYCAQIQIMHTWMRAMAAARSGRMTALPILLQALPSQHTRCCSPSCAS